MNEVFADTSFYVALSSRRDAWHAVASHYANQFSGRIVTTEFVILELGNTFTSGRARRHFTALRNFLNAEE